MGDASLIPSLPYNSVDFDKPEEWLDQLKTEGFTVIKSVANAEEVENAKNLLWKWLEDQGTGILRNDPSTWTDEAWPEWPGYKKYGSLPLEQTPSSVSCNGFFFEDYFIMFYTFDML